MSTGFAKVVSLNPNVVLAELEKALSAGDDLPTVSPFGDGRASERIVDVVKRVL